MRALGLTTYGGPEVLRPVELPEPHAGPGEVRVAVRAAALNPADVMLRDGSLAAVYEGLEPPYVPGMDVAGLVDEVGPDVDPEIAVETGRFVVGVVDNTGSHGGYSEHVVLPAASVTAAPAGASFAEAASFLMNALTARNALDVLALPEGSSVLVTGAAGAVGGYAVALAHAEGLRVVALASPADEAALRAAGADEFVPRGDDAVVDVLGLVPGGVDAVIDAACLYDRITPAVRDGGTLVDLRFWDGDPGRGIHVAHVNVRERATDHAAIVRLREQVEAGLLPMRVAATFSAADVFDAHHRLDRGGLRGRVVLLFGDGREGTTA
ncbi:NADP-dependent oxidoreductase [Isoptericola haloaureus]|uniref:NADP-dependent oxidoreductase n=1 Tax=Isoptericola haloaureus TaxID=1542902 RepID=A0ABU7Z401_9MICO